MKTELKMIDLDVTSGEHSCVEAVQAALLDGWILAAVVSFEDPFWDSEAHRYRRGRVYLRHYLTREVV